MHSVQCSPCATHCTNLIDKHTAQWQTPGSARNPSNKQKERERERKRERKRERQENNTPTRQHCAKQPTQTMDTTLHLRLNKFARDPGLNSRVESRVSQQRRRAKKNVNDATNAGGSTKKHIHNCNPTPMRTNHLFDCKTGTGPSWKIKILLRYPARCTRDSQTNLAVPLTLSFKPWKCPSSFFEPIICLLPLE